MNGNFNGTSVMENASEVQYARYAMHTFCVYQLIGKQPRMSIRIATKGRRMSLQMLACTRTVSVRPSSVVLCLLIHGARTLMPFLPFASLFDKSWNDTRRERCIAKGVL